jgi:hypothetical protein
MGYPSHKYYQLQTANNSEISTNRWQAIRDTPEPLASPPEGELLTGEEATSHASSRVELVTALLTPTPLLYYVSFYPAVFPDDLADLADFPDFADFVHLANIELR